MEKCRICSVDVAIYKCPKCRILYCSSKCYSYHREQGCEISLSKTDLTVTDLHKQNTNYTHVTEDTLSVEKLHLLDTSDELKLILKNQHLKNLLYEIDRSSNPGNIMQKMMKEPIFVEFADICLKIVEEVTDS